MTASLIQDDAALRALCARLAGAEWIALDTEFMRVRTYSARLCLIQVATPEVIACVDPLALGADAQGRASAARGGMPEAAIDSLLDVLYDAHALKVLHAARQDLEVFFDIRQAVPAPVFDTQIAAALTGYDDQIGYSALVEKITGQLLPKVNQRADWAARPLTPELVAYAADDVRYLCEVYRHLEQKLAALGRREWLVEECAAQTDVKLYRNDPELAWQRLKQGKTLAPTQQPVLAQLAAWRERVAQQKNLPRGWVVPDPALVDIARAQPENPGQLAAIPGMEPALVRRFGDEILAIVDQGKRLEPQRLWQEPSRPEPEQQRLLDAVSSRIQACAREHGVSATLLAPRREMVKFVLNEPDCALLRGWRYQLIGVELAALREVAPSRNNN
ncbi:MAG: ribonuclease D [Pseudomonadota bacterium]